VHRCLKADRITVFGGGGSAVISLAPWTLDLAYEIKDLRGVNPFSPTWDLKLFSKDTPVWSSEQFTWAKIMSRLRGEIRFWHILRRGRRVRAGSMCVELCFR